MAAKENPRFTLPVGRLINSSLFEKDAYTDPKTQKPGTPSYKIELAFDPDDIYGPDDAGEDERFIVDDLIDAGCEEWGDSFEDLFNDASEYRSPILDGDKLARRREDKGKEGDAYKGKVVIRANTQFNKHGENGPGGIEVYDENVDEVEAANQSAIWPGCEGVAVVTISNYDDSDGRKAQKFYLEAFQKTGGDPEKDKLVTKSNNKSAFAPVKKKAGAKGGTGTASRGRRKRS